MSDFCERHFSWLCGLGQGKCQEDRPPQVRVCDEGVTRGGEFVPCEKTAVAVRIDPEDKSWYAVCARHARADMVPLADLLVAFAQGWDAREAAAR